MTQKLTSNLSNLQRKVTMQTHRHHNALGYAENQDRDGFEREFWLHLNKAVNNVERATKEKHVRLVILATFKEGGNNVLWNSANRLSLQGLPIVCWKFCYVLHKVLRDGHENSVSQSQRYSSRLVEIGKLWGHLREGYGPLIAAYTKLIAQKLAFHGKYTSISGNLNVPDDHFTKMTNRDVNFEFEFAIDTLDYLDAHLLLADTVLESLDRARSNSMTDRGQCRLSPLLLSIQECTALYDLVVKALFGLHERCREADEMLADHRRRFGAMFKRLKALFENLATLQFVKTFMQVPTLNEPPNFLIAAEFATYKASAPQATILQQPDDDADEAESVVPVEAPIVAATRFEERFDTSPGGSLVDLSAPAPAPVPVASQPTQSSPFDADDSQMIIRKLLAEIERLKRELNRLVRDAKVRIDDLLERIDSLERERDELRSALIAAEQRAAKVDDSVVEAHPRFVEMRSACDASREKFTKLKGVYLSLQNEHVAALRASGELRNRLAELQRSNEKLARDAIDSAQKSAGSQFEEQVSRLKAELDRRAADCASLEKRIAELDASRAELSAERVRAQTESERQQEAVTRLNAELEAMKRRAETGEARAQKLSDVLRIASFRHFVELIVSHVSQSSETRFKALFNDDSADVAADSAPGPGDFDAAASVVRAISSTQDVLTMLRNMKQDDIASNRDGFVRILLELSTLLDSLLRDSALLRVRSVEQGDVLNGLLHSLQENLSNLFGVIAKTVPDVDSSDGQSNLLNFDTGASSSDMQQLVGSVYDSLMGVLPQLHSLVSTLKRDALEHTDEENLQGTLESEIAQAQRQVEFMTSKLAEMLAAQRGSQRSALQIEVNEKILNACNLLMQAIRVLIEKSRLLQTEIADSSASAQGGQFYKKHHRWAEGLISAAKAVGWSANYLFESADKLIKDQDAASEASSGKRPGAKAARKPRFEQLIVCSQDISASTTQLVLASRVKAAPGSDALRQLVDSSKQIQYATANVVATTKACLDLLEEHEAMDFANLTLTQAKRLEMNSQVRVLELESELEKERRRLAELRKVHYQLAGESEGWETQDQK